MSLDLKYVRSQFPALADDWIYLDNAGGSQILQPVLDRINEYLIQTNVQHGASYEVSVRATERLYRTQTRIAHMVNAARPEEIVMGSSTSQLLRTLSAAFTSRFRAGDDIVVTNFDHEANIGPWLALAKLGVEIKTWTLDRDTLIPDLDQLERLIGPRTKLVCVAHVSNVLGTLHPLEAIVQLAHDRGARVCVDGVAYVPHRLVDVSAWDVDYYVFSFYKVFGPHHAVLYGRYDDLADLDVVNHFFIGRDDVPYKFQPGGVNYELAYGCAGVVDYLETLGGRGTNDRAGLEAAFEAIAAHESVLAARLIDYLQGKGNVRIVGSAEAGTAHRVSTISFVVDGRDSEAIVRGIDPHHIGIRYGDFYAHRLVDWLELRPRKGVVRVSMVHYNTVEEVDRLIACLDELI